MDNVSSLIFPCIAGLRGNSPLSPSLLRHYPLSSVLCGHPTACNPFTLLRQLSGIPSQTHLRRRYTGSPSVDVMSLYGMADFKPRGAVRNLTITISSRIAFHLIHNVGTPVYLISGLNCLMTLPPDFLRLIYGVTVGISKVATGDVVSIFPDGISTR